MNRSQFTLFLAVSTLAASMVRADTVVTYPPGTILENVAATHAGDFIVSDLGSSTLYRISPSGASHVFGWAPGPVAGVAVNTDGMVVAVGGSSLYAFGRDGGAPAFVIPVNGAGFLNGVTVFGPNVFLVADDTNNLIWRVDLRTRSARVWLTSSLLVPPSGGLPIGPNGIKLFGGAAYISVTGAGTILRVPILPDASAGAPQVYVTGLVADDFAFGADGSLFAATQLGEVVRVYPNGARVSLQTGTLGDAAVAFGRAGTDRNNLYVVNNGGAFFPGTPSPASVVRFSTDTTGVVPESQLHRGPAWQ